MVGRVGFEPTTNGLKGRCSTTELPTQQVVGRLQNPNELKPFGAAPLLYHNGKQMQANADICTPMKHFMQIACKSETTLSGSVR